MMKFRTKAEKNSKNTININMLKTVTTYKYDPKFFFFPQWKKKRVKKERKRQRKRSNGD